MSAFWSLQTVVCVVFWEQNVSKTAYRDLIRLGSRYGVPTQYVYPTVKVSDCWSLTLNVIHTVSALWILGGNGWKLRSCLIFLHLEICQGFYVVVHIKSSYKSLDIRDMAYESRMFYGILLLSCIAPRSSGFLEMRSTLVSNLSQHPLRATSWKDASRLFWQECIAGD